MSRPARRPRIGRRALNLCAFLALLGAVVAAARPTAAGAEAGGALVAEPVLSATAAGVRQLFGASPLEAAGEVWGVANSRGGGDNIVRYTEAGSWETVPGPIDAEGNPTAGIRVPETALAGRTTAAGGVATVAALGAAENAPQALIVRNPGGQFRAVLPEEGVLEGEEKLFEYANTTLPSWIKLVPLEESDGSTGAFIVPSPGRRLPTVVLHYDGSGWSREPICLNAAPAPCQEPATPGFKLIGIDASGPGNAWLLARIPEGEEGPTEPAQGIALLHREGGEWRRQTLGGQLGLLYSFEESAVAGSNVYISPRELGQPLTVTSKGVWVDASIAIGSRTAPHSDATVYYDIGTGQVSGSWCDLLASTPEATRLEVCKSPLGSELPAGQGRSFAWPGSGAPGDFGTRAITGIGQGAMLIFENGALSRIPLAGNGGSTAGAALSAPDEGWLGPSYRLTRAPVPSGVVPWPVPFRRPLTAIAPQPGAPVADLSSEALAVGVRGQIARYLPGQGWQPESLLTGSGARATPNLRGVAWPEPGIAYAVGDEGAMWLWRSGSGLWEPDPGAPPNLIRGNFTGIAFDPNAPERGYAVGKQGLLLGYGRRWTQEALPPGVNPEVNFTSIAFAGDEALVTYTLAVPCERQGTCYVGGLLVNDGSGWRDEPGVAEALKNAEGGETSAPWRVAGLPDGGAVIAGIEGGVVEREAVGAPWQAVPGPSLGYPAAVSALREGGQVRAVLSVEGNPIGESTKTLVRFSDEPQAVGQPPEGQAPLLTGPYPLPKNGYIVRQMANGWRDEERQSYPAPPKPEHENGTTAMDLPRVADPVLALMLSPDGSHGWAVGGQTGETASEQFGPYLKEGLQTGSVMRYGNDAAPPTNSASVPIALPEGQATFAVGGNAQCAGPCADLTGTGIGPDVWLRAAVGRAAGIAGLRAFLYDGGGVSANLDLSTISSASFGAEEGAYASRLGAAAGAMPIYAAPAQTDLYGSSPSLEIFAKRFKGFATPLGEALPGAGVTPTSEGSRADGNYSYSFESRSSAGAEPVRVIVLDYTTAPLSPEKQCWLGGQLAEAKQVGAPAIVVGSREVGGDTALQQLLVTGANGTTAVLCPGEAASASAYFFDSPERNVVSSLVWGSTVIPTFGSGTLGYAKIPEPTRNQYAAATGFLLASVATQARNPTSNIAPVTARLIPSIGSLAIDAVDGTFLRRSQTALFQALARRPPAGIFCGGNNAPSSCEGVSPDSYVQIPARCIGQPSCASEILPEYAFTSSRPDIANFVAVDPASTNPRAVYLEKNGKPVADPTSGLLCAFNSGTTTVTVTTGGLSYSVPVTVQKGSVQRPCGTVPRTDLPAPGVTVPAPPPPAPTPGTNYTSPPGVLPTPPAPAPAPAPTPAPPAPTPSLPAAHHPIPAPAPAPTLPFFAASPVLTPIIAVVPPPPPPAVEPTPPSGTSPVTQPAFSPEPEEEEEAAFDLVHHMSAYQHQRARNAAVVSSTSGGTFAPSHFIPALILLLALAGAGATRRRRDSGELAYESRSTPRRSNR